MDELMTAQELADYLKINVKTLYRLHNQGKIPKGRNLSGLRWLKKDIEAWVLGL